MINGTKQPPTCNNCCGPKPDRYYKACAKCRAVWRGQSQSQLGHTPKTVRDAAQELLEQLEYVVAFLDKHNIKTADGAPLPIEVTVRAAIAKATGKEL